MESSERETTGSPGGGGESFPGLMEAAGERVQAIIEAAESSASGILEDARSEARRYADEARKRIDAVSSERTQRVSALTDELSTLGEELIGQAESMRSQAKALAGALSRAANEIYTDLEEQEAQLDRLAAEEPDLVEPGLEADFDDDRLGGLEADGPRFDEERTLALDEDDEPEDDDSGDNGSGAPRRRPLWRGFRRREEEPGTGELAVLDEVAEDEETEPELVDEPDDDATAADEEQAAS